MPSPEPRQPFCFPLRDDAPAHAARVRRRGFSQIELLVACGIVLLLAGLVVGVASTVRKSAKNVECIANLKMIGLGFQQYAAANNDKLPDPYANKKSWEASLTPYVGNGPIFYCPSDVEVAPMIGSSYDWRDTGQPATTLAGHGMAEVIRARVVLALEALPGWHVKKMINVVYLDGSTATIDQRECFEDLAKPIR